MHEQWCADTDKITFIVLDKEGAMVGEVEPQKPRHTLNYRHQNQTLHAKP